MSIDERQLIRLHDRARLGFVCGALAETLDIAARCEEALELIGDSIRYHLESRQYDRWVEAIATRADYLAAVGRLFEAEVSARLGLIGNRRQGGTIARRSTYYHYTNLMMKIRDTETLDGLISEFERCAYGEFDLDLLYFKCYACVRNCHHDQLEHMANVMLQASEHMQSERAACEAQIYCGRSLHARGRIGQALDKLNEARTRSLRGGFTASYFESCLELTRMWIEHDELDRAREELDDAIMLMSQSSDCSLVAETKFLWARYLEAHKGRTDWKDQATRLAREAASMVSRDGEPYVIRQLFDEAREFIGRLDDSRPFVPMRFDPARHMALPYMDLTRDWSLPAGISNTRNWEEREVVRRYEEVRDLLDWANTTGSARKWWDAFEQENEGRKALVLRLAEELTVRKATITEFFLAYVYSSTDNILANLHYLDYTRLKKKEEEKKRELAELPAEERPVLDPARDLPWSQPTVPSIDRGSPATAYEWALLQEYEMILSPYRFGISNTAGWNDLEIESMLQRVKGEIDWGNTTDSARKWWDAFEQENEGRKALVLRLAEELAVRKATITEFFLAYVYSSTDNILANLHYLDYTRLKKKEEEKKRELAELA